MGDLLEFYGKECSHCIKMMPLVERLESELGLTIDKIEVWHNEKNAQLLKQFDKGLCGGVPFFFNKKTNDFICGSTSYEKLKKWALGN